MTTAPAHTHVAQPPPAVPMLRRFLWKEYRMLRALWLAVAAMAVIVQFAVIVFLPAADEPPALFTTALAAAVLYAVGAAATTFSVEHEDETHGFLLGLPTTWWPIFAGKLIIAATSAALLAVVLTIVGWILGGSQTPGGNNADVIVGIFGVGIAEALAWGTLFSLLTKRPLAAALLTLVVGTVAVNFAVNWGSHYAVGSTVPRAYLEAAPLRLAIAAVVLLLGALVARGWLAVGIRAPRRKRLAWIGTRAAAKLGAAPSTARPKRRGMLSRLVWQTWRESWKLLLLPIGVTAFLVISISALVGLSGAGGQLTTTILASAFLILPALYGALAFSSDQRRGAYQFLAEHAARPRWVWLSRHIVWLGTLVALLVAIQLTAGILAAVGLRHITDEALEQYGRRGYGPYTGTAEFVFYQLYWVAFAVRGVALTALGWLTAYSLGQLCSMAMRSEILAAFIAVLLSAVLSAWAAVLFLWQLSGWLFLLPLAIGLLLSTWLRAPDWIVGRNSFRTWLKPALAILVPFAIVGVLLPVVRLAQLPMTAPSVRWTVDVQVGETVTMNDVLRQHSAHHQTAVTPTARETARLYEMAAERLAAGPKQDLLAPWAKPEYMEGGDIISGGIDRNKIPPDQVDEFNAAMDRQTELRKEVIQSAIDSAIQISERPTCHFNFDLSMVASNPTHPDYQREWSLQEYSLYRKIDDLLGVLLPAAIEQEEPFSRSLAALRMSAHIRSGQPSAVFLDQLQRERGILRRIGRWAFAPGRTKEELLEAIGQLESYFLREQPNLAAVLLADDHLVREVLRGDEPPLSLALNPDSLTVYLAFLANQLPWERERALNALDWFTLINLRETESFTRFLISDSGFSAHNAKLRQWLRPMHSWNALPARWKIEARQAETSYLTSFEYAARVPLAELYRAYIDNQVFRRAALLQLALAAYRLEHDEYPTRLADLVSDYLVELPLDPYSGQPFHYEPAGLDLPLRRTGHITNFERIEPNTPFYWSVGGSNARLMRSTDTRYEDSDSGSEHDRVRITETVYVLSSDDDFWWNDPAFVFPLPKAPQTDP